MKRSTGRTQDAWVRPGYMLAWSGNNNDIKLIIKEIFEARPNPSISMQRFVAPALAALALHVIKGGVRMYVSAEENP